MTSPPLPPPAAAAADASTLAAMPPSDTAAAIEKPPLPPPPPIDCATMPLAMSPLRRTSPLLLTVTVPRAAAGAARAADGVADAPLAAEIEPAIAKPPLPPPPPTDCAKMPCARRADASTIVPSLLSR